MIVRKPFHVRRCHPFGNVAPFGVRVVDEGLLYLVPSVQTYLVPASVVPVLIFSRKSLEAGFKRLRSLDLLFWDLRGFYSEF